jgi:hypothetical protein
LIVTLSLDVSGVNNFFNRIEAAAGNGNAGIAPPAKFRYGRVRRRRIGRSQRIFRRRRRGRKRMRSVFDRLQHRAGGTAGMIGSNGLVGAGAAGMIPHPLIL